MKEQYRLNIFREEFIPGQEVVVYKGNVVLKIGNQNYPMEATVRRFFGTDSILENQGEMRNSDIRKALKILEGGHDALPSFAFNLDYARAFKLLDNTGPITYDSEYIDIKDLTTEQITNIEDTLFSKQALKNLYGLNGWWRAHKRKEEKLGLLHFDYVHKVVGDNNVITARGSFTPDSINHNMTTLPYYDTNVRPLYECSLNYWHNELFIDRSWLTGCAQRSVALDFIQKWETTPPEERLSDFMESLDFLLKPVDEIKNKHI
jgi:hypothetical protein